jgi:hypothetical protein
MMSKPADKAGRYTGHFRHEDDWIHTEVLSPFSDDISVSFLVVF